MPTSLQSDTTSYIQKNESQLSTLNSQLFHSRDSIVYREKMIHDTVYITKEVYRDTHNSSLIARNSAQADTVRVVEYRDRVIEHPPEKYIPKFYKWCTGLLFAILVLAIGYWLLTRKLAA